MTTEPTEFVMVPRTTFDECISVADQGGWEAFAADLRAILAAAPQPVSAVRETSGLLPCPFCGAAMIRREHSAFHPDGDGHLDCWLATANEFGGGYELDKHDYASWNVRVPTRSPSSAQGVTKVGRRNDEIL